METFPSPVMFTGPMGPTETPIKSAMSMASPPDTSHFWKERTWGGQGNRGVGEVTASGFGVRCLACVRCYAVSTRVARFSAALAAEDDFSSRVFRRISKK